MVYLNWANMAAISFRVSRGLGAGPATTGWAARTSAMKSAGVHAGIEQTQIITLIKSKETNSKRLLIDCTHTKASNE